MPKEKQLNLFESEQTVIAKNIIRKEELRFADSINKYYILYCVIYSESKRTRSKDRKKIFEDWLQAHSSYANILHQKWD